MIVVVGLVVLSVVMVGVAVMAQRAAAQAHAELDRTTRFDLLTGLPDRRQLEQALDGLIGSDRKRGDGNATVMLIELCRFEVVNDTYGREVGDGLLVAVADQLKGAIEPDERLFRAGGPQFVVLATALTDTRMAERRAAELTEVLAVPFRIGTDLVQVATRVGIAMVDSRHHEARDVLFDAGVAVQQAQRDDSGRATVFDLSMRPSMSPSKTERRLREALERNEFWLLYLPVVALDDNELVGVEALLRWADPDRGLVAPDQFLPVLEDSGLIVPVGEWVIEQACRQNKIWLDAFPDRELLTTVNVSPRQLARPDFLERVLAIVGRLGHTSRAPLPRDDRGVGHARHRRRVGDAPRRQGRRHQAGARRLRHRLLLAQLPAPVQPRRAQDRPELRGGHRRQPRGRGHHPAARRHGPRPRHRTRWPKASTRWPRPRRCTGWGATSPRATGSARPSRSPPSTPFLATGVVRPASESSAGIDWSGGSTADP